MEVIEKRGALKKHCLKRVNTNGICDCALAVGENCNVNFISAPDEMIEKWYMTVFPEPVIKDSGERRQFYDRDGNPIGVRDSAKGKGRMDLLPWAAIMEVSKHCENGLEKYPAHSVDRGLPTSSFCDSGARHLAKHLAGWTDEPHLVAAAWNLLWAVQMCITHPELVDTPWKEDGE